ncbi:hypothetical protein HWV23_12945 [Natronomonas halophila]|uniref:DUF7544 domain-containing protein n=1 Tax=Natronomonas halophila TaxID=2747817 RepID=UPI0015B62DA8|nr:hypothetical protein [Natronomonas halophila]QLD86595.1 hypothetical protein HWV23_12945 [Natronomonas halophila]
MALHAAQNVGDAIDATREFLFPFELRRWLKLAVVALFIGGGLNAPSGQFGGSGSTPDPNGGGELPATLPADFVTILAVVAAVAVAFALVFGIIGAIMEFVFVESIRTDEVRLRRYWSDRWRQGLRLFGFRVLIGLPVLALFLGWVALFFAPLLMSVQLPEISAGVFLLGLPVLLVVGVVVGAVYSFTTLFVVPLMIQNDSGVLAGWRRLWPSIKREWKQYGAFALIGAVLTFVVGLIASMAVGIAAIVLLIPFAIVGVLVYLALSFSSAGTALIAVLAVIFAVVMLVVWALVQVPIVAYLRYYALLVLGDIEAEFDIIPDQREAIRD